MKKLLTLILLAGSTAFAQSEDLKEVEELFRSFVTAVESEDKEAVAKMIDYPLRRSNPIPDIMDEQDFLASYDYIFDENLIEILTSVVDDPEIQMIDRSGANGKVGFINGQIWFIYGEKEHPIASINYQSGKEQELLNSLNKDIKALLPEKIRDFDRNVYMGSTEKHVIRIDQTADSYRYTSWTVGVSCQHEPDLVLNRGELIPMGSAGSVWYLFKNGDYSYFFKRIRIGQTDADIGDFLTVEKDGKEIASWRLNQIYDQLEFISSN